jgi:phage terminase large subunit
MRKIQIDADVFNPKYLPHVTKNQRRYQLFYGGASSGKSYFIAQRVVLDAMAGRNTLVVRNVARTLRGSCWNEILKAIDTMGLGKYFTVNKSDYFITSMRGWQIIFAGLDDVEKIKSITPAQGVLTDIWMEEATETAYDDYKQLDKRLRGQSDHPKRITLSFNPVFKTHWIYSEFFGIWDDSKQYAETDNLSILKTTYKDNLFLTAADKAALEGEKDEYYREVYTLGNWGIIGDLIFRNWRTEDLTEFATHADNIRIGLDFGFSSDPCAVVKLHYDRMRKRIYVLDEVYERGLVNQQLAGILQSFAGGHYVTCDSAEPKSIAELRNYGINAVPAKKGADSVEHGIQWLQSHEIIVDTHCQNTRNELAMYQWRKDKDGNSMRIPEGRNDHILDAVRYSLEAESTARYATTFNREGLGI